MFMVKERTSRAVAYTYNCTSSGLPQCKYVPTSLHASLERTLLAQKDIKKFDPTISERDFGYSVSNPISSYLLILRTPTRLRISLRAIV